MAFDTVRVRKVRKDDEDSFLDWDGRATLFDDDEEVDEPDEVESELEVDGEDDGEVAAGAEGLEEVGEPDEL